MMGGVITFSWCGIYTWIENQSESNKTSASIKDRLEWICRVHTDKQCNESMGSEYRVLLMGPTVAAWQSLDSSQQYSNHLSFMNYPNLDIFYYNNVVIFHVLKQTTSYTFLTEQKYTHNCLMQKKKVSLLYILCFIITHFNQFKLIYSCCFKSLKPGTCVNLCQIH